MNKDRKDLGGLYPAVLPTTEVSRGTSEQISLSEAVVYDFMPPMIGSRFMASESLKKRIHFYGQETGSFMDLEETNRQIAEEELNKGNLEEAIDAYKNCLHDAVGFLCAISTIQEHALLSISEYQRLDLDSRFGDLEGRLMAAISKEDISINAEKYSEFIKNVRNLEKRGHQLNQLFFMGESRWYEHIKAPSKYDPELGKEYIDVCVQMGKYSEASWVAAEMGNKEDAAKFKKLSKGQPKEHPRFREIYTKLGEDRDF